MNENWGNVEIILKDYMIENGISKNSIVKKADMQFSQFQAYYNNEAQRIDLYVLARICTALKCDITDVLRFNPPTDT